jgi:hypothetical protein
VEIGANILGLGWISGNQKNLFPGRGGVQMRRNSNRIGRGGGGNGQMGQFRITGTIGHS